MTDVKGESNRQDKPASEAEIPDPKLLELLVCPLTKKPLVYDPKRHELVSKAAKLAFPIKSGIPLMTLEAARHLDDE
ncbi:conserved protein of unknown function [Candidatus Filomicrobium marinum]|uniref:UPF0434 protein YBN1229_v1_1197 n=2 Tax=Filomicrobium TaxID=119044 RepID=A0A0D6JCQ0_9HYPH|nr:MULTISPECIES: Trm112 family protein [Filomicrobium]MCV0368367.1 Trm112 family protein [Filomicrobium sp.]CFX11683.1 conserved protein of unknown function [Candidatus Filomicrobium marinum]CPR17317.1 conserved protein of unknown function [Candidatus Filomicrobium marinum]SDO36084.1 hypothetical protein SAMN04488061_0990 [Filomicrobium insigne]